MEGVIVKNDPEYQLESLSRLESLDINISGSVNTHWLCKSVCEYTFFDVSKGQVIDSGFFNVTTSRFVNYENSILVNETGFGQLIYTYKLSCSNIPTNTCQAGTTPKVSNSIITVNYEPNEEDYELKSLKRSEIDFFFNELYDAKNSLFRIKHYLNITSNIDFFVYESLYEEKEDLMKGLEEEVFILQKAWSSLDLRFLEEYDFAEKISYLNQTHDLERSIVNDINFYNQVVDSLNNLDETFVELLRHSSNETLKEFENNINRLKKEVENKTSILLLQTYYEELEDFKEEVELSFLDNFDKDLLYLVFLYNQSNCPTCFFDLNHTFNDTEDYIEVTQYLCSSVNIENMTYSTNETRTLKAKAKKILEFKEYHDYSDRVYEDEQIVRTLLNQQNLSFENYEDYELGDYYKLYEEEDLDKIKDLQKKCERNIEKNYTNENKISLVVPESNITKKELGQVKSVCCAYGECETCDEQKRNPVIFLHGHSVSLRTSADYSSDSFNRIMNELEREGYYIYGPLVRPIREQEYKVRGDLGRNHKPTMFKATYYYTTYFDGLGYATSISMTENIDTYAIRLKEIIDYVKYSTNSQEVDIVAHSMGGLVTRRYIQIFGEEHVDNVIMIGTPNQGITNRIYNACSLLGDNKECRDMKKRSTFLQGLNDPYYEPTNTNYYTITGLGCLMNEGDGDGIVIGENVKLSYAKNFNVTGTCEEGLMLHSNMLNPKIYPEVYWEIIDLLKRDQY